MTKPIIVTGAFGTLGRAVVSDLQSRGHAIAALDLAPADSVHGELQLGGVDLTDEGAVGAAFSAVEQQLGALGGLVNVAGGFLWETILEGSLDSWERMYAMNLRSAVVSCRAAVPLFARDGGSIVNVGAAGANPAGAGMAPYAASKAGTLALTQSLADELQERRIRVNAILPTILDTPANRASMPDADPSNWIAPADAARVISFLISDEARAINGAAIPLRA